METVTIPKEEYESLKAVEVKIKIIDRTIHESNLTEELMRLQEKQQAFAFLEDEKQNIYSLEDLKEAY